MTTKVTITADTIHQKKLVSIKVGSNEPVTIGSGESHEAYVYDGQTITVSEVDAPQETAGE